MFSNFFKPRWQHKKPDVRINAINEFNLNDKANIARLEQIILNDDNELVRTTAIEKINQFDTLTKLANDCKDSDRKKLLTKIIQTITAGNISLSQIKSLIQQYPALPLLNLFAEHCPHQDELLNWLDELPLETTLVIANLSRFDAIKEKVLNSIHDEEILRKLSKQSDKLDKRSNQLIRDKLKTIREEAQIKNDETQKLEKLVSRLEALSRTEHNSVFDQELFQLSESWKHTLKQLKNTHNELVSKGNDVLTQCENIKNQAELERVAALEKFAQENLEEAKATPIVDTAPATKEEPTISLIEEIRAAQNAVDKEKERQKNELSKKTLLSITQELEQLDQAIEEKNLKSAKSLAASINNAMRLLNTNHAKMVSQKFQLLQNQVKELNDWLEFSTLPKLEELCVQMEHLAQISLPIPQKAAAIKDIQKQWQGNKIPSSPAAKDLWNRFKQASDTAYEPCAAYFSKEKELRSHNLSQRIKICESLEQYYQEFWGDNTSSTDSKTIDWKALQNIINTAKKEFHDFYPVERNEEKPIKERFDGAIKQLNNQLIAEQQRNEAQKQQLIDESKSLLDIEDFKVAMEKVKELQQQWKLIGHGRRHQDQKLWETFHKSCNAVFEKRQYDREQAINEQKEKLSKAEDICRQISELTQLSDDQIVESMEKFNELKNQFLELSDNDRPKTSLNRLFKEACHAFNQHVHNYREREKQQEFERFTQLANICKQLEYRPSTEQIEHLVKEWQDTIVSSHFRSLLTPRHQLAMSVAKNESSIDFAQNESLRRQLCVELEILTGSDTPDEDQKLRSEFQIHALQKNFGKGVQNLSERKENLISSWYTLGAASPEAQAVLEERFNKIKHV